MTQPLTWLRDAQDTPWSGLAQAMRANLPAPDGFVISAATPEEEIRAAYEELKLREKTHYVAVRAQAFAVLNIVGPDFLLHTIRRYFAENPHASVLVQRIVPAAWCGKAYREAGAVVIKANEGYMVLDPDSYVISDGAGVTQKIVQPAQRNMIRHVDGTTKVI
jgi:hypothetical protein